MSSSSMRTNKHYPIYLVMMMVGAIGANAVSLVDRLSLQNWGGLGFFALPQLGGATTFATTTIVVASISVALGLVAYIAANASKWLGLAAFSLFSSSGAERRKSTQQPSLPTPNDIEGVRDGLDQQLSDLVNIVGRYLETVSKQSDTFQTVQAGLSADGTVEQIRSIVEILVSLSAEGQSEAEALRAELKDAQTQALTLRRKLVKVEKLATLDPLTSLPNRRHFDEYIDAAVTESHDDFTPLSVVMIDIDHFKRINDSFGHPTGDAVLKQMASLIAKSVRSNDLVARFGGEEFVLVLKKTAKGDARQIAERIRTNILAENWVNPKSNAGLGKVTASFGIAEIIDNEEPDGLVARADKQLYSAKKLGRNRVEMDMTR